MWRCNDGEQPCNIMLDWTCQLPGGHAILDIVGNLIANVCQS
jgi:hypothetical protein